MKKVDQNGDEIPDDLVTLPDIAHLSCEEIVVVEKARWYETVSGSPIMASAKEIKHLSEDDPEDSGIDLGEQLLLIDDVLKRQDYACFYHA